MTQVSKDFNLTMRTANTRLGQDRLCALGYTDEQIANTMDKQAANIIGQRRW